MRTTKNSLPGYAKLARRNLPLAENIARRLHRRYRWVDIEDLSSYAYLGVTLAARSFDPERGVPFERFACTKAMYLAIDEMRKDGILRRADATHHSQDSSIQETDMPDPAADRAAELMEAREFCEEMFHRLDQDGRELLGMVYAEKLTYREISRVLGVSESAVCLRHKALLEKLRRQSSVRQMAA
ncbi:MAG: sigma-70 family RNA polymerase sigma factor [Phycisphaerae bacterium]|nr:sigma-70 family RNA polymerase sigma factor [Phycisphaerae bacterium]